jgi:hypothetical protein
MCYNGISFHVNIISSIIYCVDVLYFTEEEHETSIKPEKKRYNVFTIVSNKLFNLLSYISQQSDIILINSYRTWNYAIFIIGYSCIYFTRILNTVFQILSNA